MTRLIIVDDHTLFRESLCRFLNAEEGLQIVGHFPSAESALQSIASGLVFDVALIDYDLPSSGTGRTSGVNLCETLAAQRPDARLLMVTAGLPNAEAQKVVQDLGIGLFLKTEPIMELLLAIQRTARREQWVSSAVALSMLTARDQRGSQSGLAGLTSRERAVLRSVLEGLSNKEISQRLDLSESGVKATLQRLFDYTGVRSRSQLVRIAIEQQIAFD